MRKELFTSDAQRLPEADTVNNAGGKAYSMTAKHELAQYAVTGTFGDTYYVSGEKQLARMQELVPEVDSEFIAKLAVYAREDGYMKDMPAFLAATLATRGEEGIALLKQVFPRVIDNGRMLRNFVQTIRSGVLGRKSLGSAPRNLVRAWLAGRHPAQLFRDSVGNNPSIADIIKMVHPTPRNGEEEAMFGYLIGKEHKFANLPSIVQQYENFKFDNKKEIPNVEFRLLTGLELSDTIWTEIARNARWMMTRMNLNTFARHGVFNNPEMVDIIAARLRDPEEVHRSRNFPFQLFTAWRAIETNDNIPVKVKSALQDAVDISLDNVPSYEGKNIAVCVDHSGSMYSPVLGYSPRGYSGMFTYNSDAPMCVDVAGMMASAILRKNPEAQIIAFTTDAKRIHLNPRDTITTNTEKIRRLGAGGTDCSSALRLMNQNKTTGVDLVVFVSDYESWVDGRGVGYYGRSTSMMGEWQTFKKRNKNAKLVCIDCVPHNTVQAPDRNEIINIGGFSDVVFQMMDMFMKNELDTGKWVGHINSTQLA